MPIRDNLKYAIQIADALAKAHKAGIIHRDLKPSNISTLAAVLHEEPEPASRIAGAVPAELERIIARCQLPI